MLRELETEAGIKSESCQVSYNLISSIVVVFLKAEIIHRPVKGPIILKWDKYKGRAKKGIREFQQKMWNRESSLKVPSLPLIPSLLLNSNPSHTVPILNYLAL